MTTSVFESLMITIGLDPAGFTKGRKEVSDGLDQTGKDAEKARKRIEEEAKRQAEAFRKVRDSVLEVAAVIVGAVAGSEFVKAITRSDLSVSNLGRNVNATTKEVSVLEGMFRHLGSSASEADGFLNATNQILQEIRVTGTAKALQPFALAKLDTGKFRDAKDYFERLQMLADAASNMDAPLARYHLGQAGYDDGTINVILQGAEALRKLRQAQEELNYTTPMDAAAAKERTGAWADFDRALEGLGRTIATEFTPLIIGATKAFTWLFNTLSHNTPAAVGLIGGLIAAMGYLKGFALVKWAEKMGGAFGIIGEAAGLLLKRLSLVLATLTALYEIWKTAKAIFDWYGATHREGIKLTPQAQARIDAGEANGVKIGPGTGTVAGGTSAWDSLIQGASTKWGVPPELIRAVMQQESGGNPNAVGPLLRDGTHAQGLMQLIPGTAGDMGVSNPYDPGQNIDGGAHYLHDLLGKYGGNIQMALAAYNWGPNNLDRQGIGKAPDQTRNYVASIMAGISSRSNGGGGAVNVSIGNVTMQTTASTVEGHGQDLGKGVRNYILASQSNTGVN